MRLRGQGMRSFVECGVAVLRSGHPPAFPGHLGSYRRSAELLCSRHGWCAATSVKTYHNPTLTNLDSLTAHKIEGVLQARLDDA